MTGKVNCYYANWSTKSSQFAENRENGDERSVGEGLLAVFVFVVLMLIAFDKNVLVVILMEKLIFQWLVDGPLLSILTLVCLQISLFYRSHK